MRVTGWLLRRWVELGWAAFAAVNVAAMVAWPSWETIPFHFVWISLTIFYGFRVWSPRVTAAVLAAVAAATGASILSDAYAGVQLWGELFEVPLMAAMFLAMVWHARRREEAMEETEQLVEVATSLLERQERFLNDASHELRTPVTIARGHLELLRWEQAESHELAIAIDELDRMDRIIERLLLLAKADQPDFVVPEEIALDRYLEDVFMRWAEVAPRAWRLGPLASGTLRADVEALREALDALLENAVKYSEPGDAIEVRSTTGEGGMVSIEVADAGAGVPPEALDRIFERFARSDAARTRAHGGVGLGLAIVDAVAKAHGGACSVASSERGSTFTLTLPGFEPRQQTVEQPVPAATNTIEPAVS
jgi:two-component system OmpR family sensor kinase